MIVSAPNEDGVVFVTGEPHKYIVCFDVEGETTWEILSAREIFSKMEFDDCYDISIKRLMLIDGYKTIACKFFTTWHNAKDPLRVEIRHVITNEVYDVGYQPEH